jgi:hypothetical protein
MQKWVITLLLNWVWGKASDLLLWALKKYKDNKELKEIEEANRTQAEKVQILADEIRLMIQRGEEVPEFLKERLREESRRLVHGPDASNGRK